MPKPNSTTREEWIKEANCRGMNPNLFFPEDDRETNKAKRKYSEDAINACASCPVLEPCQEWAILHESYGFQGGLTPVQRAKVRSRLNIILWEPQSNITTSRTVPTVSPIQHGTPTGYKQERQRGMSACDDCLLAHRNATKRVQAS